MAGSSLLQPYRTPRGGPSWLGFACRRSHRPSVGEQRTLQDSRSSPLSLSLFGIFLVLSLSGGSFPLPLTFSLSLSLSPFTRKGRAHCRRPHARCRRMCGLGGDVSRLGGAMSGDCAFVSESFWSHFETFSQIGQILAEIAPRIDRVHGSETFGVFFGSIPERGGGHFGSRLNFLEHLLFDGWRGGCGRLFRSFF